jgi:hypothetical protein
MRGPLGRQTRVPEMPLFDSRRLLSLVGWLGLALTAFGCDAWITADGKIQNEGGRPLPNARIRITSKALPDSGILILTDSSGQFHVFENVAPGRASAHIRVEASGHKPYDAEVEDAIARPWRADVTLAADSSTASSYGKVGSRTPPADSSDS